MRTVRQNLPGIDFIATVSASDLPARVDYKAAAGDTVAILGAVTPIEFTGEAVCVHKRNIDDGVSSEEAELTYTTPNEPERRDGVAYVIRDVSGRSYLIGGREQPMPQITWTRSTGETTGGAAVYTVKVSHRALRTLIDCVVNVC